MGLDKLILPDGRNRLGGYMTTVSVIGKLTLPDGRNRLVGYMKTVSVICKLILPDGGNRLGGYIMTVSVIGNNDGRWDEVQHYASTRQCLQNGKMTLPSGKGALSSARQNK